MTYDICDAKRLRRVYDCMRSWGEHMQYSVFRCRLTKAERIRLESELSRLIHHDEDQILFINLGPYDGRGREAVEALGRTYEKPDYKAIII